MENITREETSNTPYIHFDTCGHLIMQGRSFPKKVRALYDPLIEFVSAMHAPSITFDINLDYINSSSTKRILELLESIENNPAVQSIQVNWFFEEGDDDSLEIAQLYEDALTRTVFVYNEYAEA